MIIVDSVIALFRVDFSGRGDLSVRQQKLGRHLSNLLQMASVSQPDGRGDHEKTETTQACDTEPMQALFRMHIAQDSLDQARLIYAPRIRL